MEKDIIQTYFDRLQLFAKSDKLSVIVGLILTPLLFGGAGIGVLMFKNDTLGKWIAFSLFGGGVLLTLFILVYAQKLKKRKAQILIGNLVKVKRLTTATGEAANWLVIQVNKAYEVDRNQTVTPLKSIENTTISRLSVLKSNEAIEAVRRIPDNSVFLCTGHGYVVAFGNGPHLTDYRY